MLLVFGSINLDLSFRTPRLPVAGETVLASGLVISPGGKGANQAHAAALYGVATHLVGAVGEVALAEAALPLLRQAGVDLSALQRLPGATGCASIAVDAAGQNQIMVAPGVNLALTHQSVNDALLHASRAVLLQMETDPAQNLALLKRAKAAGCLTLLNNAPAQALTDELRGRIDVLIVNEGELMVTAQAAGAAMPLDPVSALRHLAGAGTNSIVLTLGAQGAMAWHQGALLRAAALPLVAVDTTGAGDTFCGVLAAALAQGQGMASALRQACVAGSLACLRPGAQVAQPSRAEIDAAMAVSQGAGGAPSAGTG